MPKIALVGADVQRHGDFVLRQQAAQTPTGIGRSILDEIVAQPVDEAAKGGLDGKCNAAHGQPGYSQKKEARMRRKEAKIDRCIPLVTASIQPASRWAINTICEHADNTALVGKKAKVNSRPDARWFLLLALAAAVMACAGAGAAPMPVSAVASIEEMQAQNGGAIKVLQVMSYHTGLGQGGGLFAWSPIATSPPDNCVSFAGNGAPTGRWVRQWSGPLNATMCGAYWDAVHDDSAVLTRAFAVASALHRTLDLPGGTAKVCSSVTAARAVIVRGQGMGTAGDTAPSPTIIDGACMKSGWVFDIVTPNGTTNFEAPKYYDMEIRTANTSSPGGCIRWNSVSGGFTDSPASQYYMVHPHAERIWCNQQARQQTGLECSKCFDGDFSQNNITAGNIGIALEGSDVMCIGCAGPNRIAYTTGSLIRLAARGTFGNMDRIVANELLYPTDSHTSYDSFIFDGARSSTIESNHIEGVIAGAKSVIHVAGGFSHAILDNDIDVLTNMANSAPHWLIAEGPFVNFRAFNNGCGGCILGPALFTNRSATYNNGGVPQIITHGGNAANGDDGFPFNSGR